MTDLLERIENRFDTDRSVAVSHEYWHWSFFISAFYVVSIFALQRWMRDREKYDLRKPLFFWSLTLSLFSFYGFYINGTEYLKYFYNHGWERVTCDRVLTSGRFGLWSFLFCFSKFPELLDTYFIILRKQKLIFLHWYHHVTVYIYCWYNWPNMTSPAQWFIIVNYFVHAVMYLYFAIRASGRYRPPLWVNILITVLQLLQMVFGTYVNVYLYRRMSADPNWYCDGRVEVTYFYVYTSLAMYSSYFVLFIHFFVTTYILKRKKENPDKKREGVVANENHTDKVVKTWSTRNGLVTKCNGLVNGVLHRQ